MVRIYTKGGDTGKTVLQGGISVSKADTIFDVLGTLDELNSSLGIVTSHINNVANGKVLKTIQSDLFTLGALISSKKSDPKAQVYLEKGVSFLEKEIDKLEKSNKPLKNFILPGGSKVSSFIHLSRSVCRRAERECVKNSGRGFNSRFNVAIKYLNRLSDFLFVLARYNNNKGKKDIIWKSNL